MEKRSRCAVCNLLTGRGRNSGGGHVCQRAGKGPHDLIRGTFSRQPLWASSTAGSAWSREVDPVSRLSSPLSSRLSSPPSVSSSPLYRTSEHTVFSTMGHLMGRCGTETARLLQCGLGSGPRAGAAEAHAGFSCEDCLMAGATGMLTRAKRAMQAVRSALCSSFCNSASLSTAYLRSSFTSSGVAAALKVHCAPEGGP